jgi:hypothetical protein
LDPGVDLRIVQLDGEGMIGATGPWVHPHCHLPLPEWQNAVTDEGPQEVHTRQPGLEQLLDNVAHGF